LDHFSLDVGKLKPNPKDKEASELFMQYGLPVIVGLQVEIDNTFGFKPIM